MSRPTKKPSDSELAQLSALSIVLPEARAILNQCNPPAHWGDDELYLILGFIMYPTLVHAQLINTSKFEVGKGLPEGIETALKWTTMFLEAPSTMIAVLPRLDKKLSKLTRSPQQALLFCFALRWELQDSFGPDEFCQRFLGADKAETLVDELKKDWGISLTIKNIEHVRDELRRKLKFPPKDPSK